MRGLLVIGSQVTLYAGVCTDVRRSFPRQPPCSLLTPRGAAAAPSPVPGADRPPAPPRLTCSGPWKQILHMGPAPPGWLPLPLSLLHTERVSGLSPWAPPGLSGSEGGSPLASPAPLPAPAPAPAAGGGSCGALCPRGGSAGRGAPLMGARGGGRESGEAAKVTPCRRRVRACKGRAAVCPGVQGRQRGAAGGQGWRSRSAAPQRPQTVTGGAEPTAATAATAAAPPPPAALSTSRHHSPSWPPPSLCSPRRPVASWPPAVVALVSRDEPVASGWAGQSWGALNSWRRGSPHPPRLPGFLFP